MTNGIATWRCKCGVTVKVATETDADGIHDDVRVEAECPICGDKQLVHAYRIIGITAYINSGDKMPSE
jgi:hypothetical protein